MCFVNSGHQIWLEPVWSSQDKTKFWLKRFQGTLKNVFLLLENLNANM